MKTFFAGTPRFALFGCALLASVDTQAAMTARTTADRDYTGSKVDNATTISAGHADHAGGAGTSIGMGGQGCAGVTKMAKCRDETTDLTPVFDENTTGAGICRRQ